MRSFMFVSLVLVLMVGIAMAGGIVTNTNQSAAYMRTLNRNASTDIDAAYFNPAGLTTLEDGLHLSLSNQSIWQKKTVTNNYGGMLQVSPTISLPYGLNNDEYVGEVVAPLFPNLYLAYKMGSLVVSGGFEPIGGGGSANYKDGLPSFEMPVSDLVPGLLMKGENVDKYSADVAFEGSSVYYGFQGNISYKINDMISVGVGGRYVSAINTYTGHLKSIGINYNGTMIPAKSYFDEVVTKLQPGVTGLKSALDGGYPSTTPLKTIDATGDLTNGLLDMGVDTTGITLGEAYSEYLTNYLTASAKSKVLTDQDVDVIQRASGFSPILSVMITPMKGLDIAFRYEGLTKLELENEADSLNQALVGFEDDGVTPIYKFPDGAKTRADMPAMMALGVSYKLSDALRTEFGLNYYMNSGVNWEGREEDVDNGYEVGLAVEYSLNDKLMASVGFLNGNGGAKPDYQTDISYSLKSNTIGLGFAYKVSDNMTVNFGALNTFYQDDSRDGQHDLGGSGNLVDYTEEYAKTTYGFAFGIDYKF